jgi:broad specificity phosphatase PhoE
VPVNESAKRVLVVRHGESTWNAVSRWQGQADPPLSGLGERQARAAVPTVAALGLAALVSSDLIRARGTAELLAPPDITVTGEPAFRERNAGEWTGLTRAEIEERYPGALEERRNPPGFEGDEALLARALPALESVFAGLADGECALVVSHGGVIGTLERHFGERSAPIPNLGGRWIDAGGDGIVLGDRALLIDADEVELTIPGQI